MTPANDIVNNNIWDYNKGIHRRRYQGYKIVYPKLYTTR